MKKSRPGRSGYRLNSRRNRGQNTEFVTDELRRYVTGWMNYFGISHTYAAVLELDEWSLDDQVAFLGAQMLT